MHLLQNVGKIFKTVFRKFSSRNRSTLLCSNGVKFGRREIDKIVRYLLDKNKFCLFLRLSLLRGSCLSGVIAERMNTSELPRKVNTIFARSLAFS